MDSPSDDALGAKAFDRLTSQSRKLMKSTDLQPSTTTRYLSELGRRALVEESENKNPSIWDSFRRLSWVQAIIRIVGAPFLQPCANRWQAAQDASSLRPRDKRSSPSVKRLWWGGPPSEEKVFLGTRERSTLRDNLYRQVKESAKNSKATMVSEPEALPSAHEDILLELQNEIQAPELNPGLQAVFSDETATHLRELMERELSVGVGDLEYSVRYQKEDSNNGADAQQEVVSTKHSPNSEVVLEIDFRTLVTSPGAAYNHPTEKKAAEGTASGKLVLRLTHDGKATAIRVISLDVKKTFERPKKSTETEEAQTIADAAVASNMNSLGLQEVHVSTAQTRWPAYEVLSPFLMEKNYTSSSSSPAQVKIDFARHMLSYAKKNPEEVEKWPEEIKNRLNRFKIIAGPPTVALPDDGQEHRLDLRMLSALTKRPVVVFYPEDTGFFKAARYEPDLSSYSPSLEADLLEPNSEGPTLIYSARPDSDASTSRRWASVSKVAAGDP